jgi:hypothetical protein
MLAGRIFERTWRTAVWAGTRAIGAAFLLAGATAAAYAGSEERKGTGGALELRIPVGARGSALGGSVVADVPGVEAIFWNPAGLAYLEGTEAMFTHTEYLADINLNYAAVGTNLGSFGVLGLSVKALDIGDVIVTTEDAPEGTGEILTPTFAVIGVSYARRFTDRVLFGGTLNFVNERIANAQASGLAIDLGVQYTTGWRGLAFGVAMKNVGSQMSFSGEDFETSLPPTSNDPTARNRVYRTTSADFELPSYFSLGATYDAWASGENRLAVMAAFQNNNFVGNNLQGGLEYSIGQVAQLRGSYYATWRESGFGVGSESGTEVVGGDDVYSGFALGVGAKARLGGAARMQVDLAWRPVRDYFDDTLELGLKFGF